VFDPNRSDVRLLECGVTATCDPVVLGPFTTVRAPLRITCRGDADQLIVNGDADGGGEPPHPIGFWGCGAPLDNSTTGRSGIDIMPTGQQWKLWVAEVLLPGNADRDYGTGGRYSIVAEAWNGPWREKVCGRQGSAYPTGRWHTCISKEYLEERQTNSDTPSTSD